MTEPTNSSLSFRVGAYLDINEYSQESLVQVRDVLARFDWMVSLATNRALEALPLADIIEPVQALAKVLPFRHERLNPRAAADHSEPTPA